MKEMQNPNTIELPGAPIVVKYGSPTPLPRGTSLTSASVSPAFGSVCEFLSTKALQRPNRTRPAG
jgi:hypothetical protein